MCGQCPGPGTGGPGAGDSDLRESGVGRWGKESRPWGAEYGEEGGSLCIAGCWLAAGGAGGHQGEESSPRKERLESSSRLRGPRRVPAGRMERL